MYQVYVANGPYNKVIQPYILQHSKNLVRVICPFKVKIIGGVQIANVFNFKLDQDSHHS